MGAPKRTHCPKGHLHEGTNLVTNNKGDRLCRICVNESSKRSAQKRKGLPIPIELLPGVRRRPSNKFAEAPKLIKTKWEKRQEAIITQARGNRKFKNIEFNLTTDDLVWPEYCPIFNTKLDYYKETGKIMDAPSLDRVDPHKGYTKDNVRIISYRANTRKGEMTVEQVARLLNYMTQVR